MTNNFKDTKNTNNFSKYWNRMLFLLFLLLGIFIGRFYDGQFLQTGKEYCAADNQLDRNDDGIIDSFIPDISYSTGTRNSEEIISDIQRIISSNNIDNDLLNKIFCTDIKSIGNNSNALWSQYLYLISAALANKKNNMTTGSLTNLYNGLSKYDYDQVMNNPDDRAIIYKYIYNYLQGSGASNSGQIIPIIYIYTGGNTYINNNGGGGGNNSTGSNSSGTNDPLRPYTQYFRCASPFGGTPIEHGKSIFVYKYSSVNYPETCVGESRACDNGTLLGSYTNQNCVQVGNSCTTPWGTTLKHGETIKAFSDNSLPYSQDCGSVSKNLQCVNGLLGSSDVYIYNNCKNEAPKNCVGPDGKIYGNNEISTYYKYSKVVGEPRDGEDICPRQARLCYDGSWYNLDKTQKLTFTYTKSNCIAIVE